MVKERRYGGDSWGTSRDEFVEHRPRSRSIYPKPGVALKHWVAGKRPERAVFWKSGTLHQTDGEAEGRRLVEGLGEVGFSCEDLARSKSRPNDQTRRQRGANDHSTNLTGWHIPSHEPNGVLCCKNRPCNDQAAALTAQSTSTMSAKSKARFAEISERERARRRRRKRRHQQTGVLKQVK